MGTSSRSGPRIFVSHSHKDEDFTQQLVGDLHAAGAEVWVDVVGIEHGNFMQAIDEALQQCEWMVLVLTPNALASRYVKDEVYSALHRVNQGYMRGVIPVLAAPCVTGSIPPQWDVLQRYDATRSYTAALAAMLNALGMGQNVQRVTTAPTVPGKPKPVPVTSQWPPTPTLTTSASPVLPRERFPVRLERLGFVAEIGRDPDTGKETPFIRPPLCPVPAGLFLMGRDPRQDSGRFDDDRAPQHDVTLPSYHIGKFPVTVAEFACFVASGRADAGDWRWRERQGKLDHPVVGVEWDEATAYAAWLATLTGQPWRLPSEAEWEKAALWDPYHRTSRSYPWGEHFDAARCNTSERGYDDDNEGTTAVGMYGPENPTCDGSSPCGAQDMAGNVWEWTSGNGVLRGGMSRGLSGYAMANHRDQFDTLGLPRFRVVLFASG